MSQHSRQVSRALVLAAGQGTRLGNRTPKPLFELLGLPLLVRTLCTLERAGIAEAYVVLGYEADRVRAEIEKHFGHLKIRVHWLRNDAWERPNGLSVLTGEAVLNEPFILAMSDHVFDPQVVTALCERSDSVQGVDLAVDRRPERVTDLAEATKVRVEDGRIAAIGKTIPHYDAVDTGVFLATPAIFGAIRTAQADGKEALSDAVQKLADRGEARITDIGNLLWQDVDTPRDATEAERKLLYSVRKPSDGIVARWLNRPVSIAVSRLLVRTPITPNQVTFANLLLGLAAAGVAVMGGYTAFLVAGILFHVTSILDGTDGEVAKLKFLQSKRGEWFDTIADNITYLAFLLGVMVGARRTGLPDFYLFWGIVGLAVASITFVNLHFYLARRRKSGSFLSVQYGFEDGNTLYRRVMRVVSYLGKRDLMAFLVLLLAVFGQAPMLLPTFGIGATLLLLPYSTKVNLETLIKERSARRRHRQKQSISTPAPAYAVARSRRYWFSEERSEVSQTGSRVA